LGRGLRIFGRNLGRPPEITLACLAPPLPAFLPKYIVPEVFLSSTELSLDIAELVSRARGGEPIDTSAKGEELAAK
jgi:hypothetical protein